MTSDPFALFDAWLAEARASEPNDPEAMALATADAAGNPSVRMVLLKGHGPDGFVFYTNDGSRKGERARGKPARRACCSTGNRCAARCGSKGRSSAFSDAEADDYFATRARDSQLGAWASDQSRPLDSRATFEARFADVQRRFEGERRAAPAALGRLRRRPASGSSSGATVPTGSTNGGCSRATASGWSEGLLYP